MHNRVAQKSLDTAILLNIVGPVTCHSVYTYIHIQLATEEFAVDLGGDLRWGKTTILFL